jgi:oligopeptide transport system ATP-binding protein
MNPAAPTTNPLQQKPLLQVRDLRVHYRVSDNKGIWPRTRQLEAVKGIGFDLYPGETLGVVGESGCGKSSLAKALIGLIPSQSSQLNWLGQDLTHTPLARWGSVRRDVQMVFQDPLSSLDPRLNVLKIVSEPLRTHEPGLSAEQLKAAVIETLNKVGLEESVLYRYPHEMSGGQCQRIGIARAIILRPKVIVCDEPVSALDVSIQAQIIQLLRQLQREMKLTLVFISHDLAVVKHISHRVMVMYLGKMMELGPKDLLFKQPAHPYTQALLDAVPKADPQKERHKSLSLLSGDIPSPLDPPAGCVFHTRCTRADAQCSQQAPTLQANDEGGVHACWQPIIRN